MKNPIKMDDLGVPLFLETSKYQAQNQAFQSFGNFHVQHLSGEPLNATKEMSTSASQTHSIPKHSMYGIFTYIYHRNSSNVSMNIVVASFGCFG